MSYEDIYKNPLDGDYVVACTVCGWKNKVRLSLGVGLRVGDSVYKDPDNVKVNTCGKCKRQSLVVEQTPPAPVPDGPKGFWKIPSE